MAVATNEQESQIETGRKTGDETCFKCKTTEEFELIIEEGQDLRKYHQIISIGESFTGRCWSGGVGVEPPGTEENRRRERRKVWFLNPKLALLEAMHPDENLGRHKYA